ncbi:hypothetical protein DMENIID0001_049310 [Sergentomyia squamirostris]
MPRDGQVTKAKAIAEKITEPDSQPPNFTAMMRDPTPGTSHGQPKIAETSMHRGFVEAEFQEFDASFDLMKKKIKERHNLLIDMIESEGSECQKAIEDNFNSIKSDEALVTAKIDYLADLVEEKDQIAVADTFPKSALPLN